MLNTDRPDFKRHLKVLFAAYTDFPMRDEQEEAYWLGLHHARLSEVVANIAKLCGCAKKGVPVPRPGDLLNVQPADRPTKDARVEAAFESADKFSTRTWDAMMRDDPELARLELGIAQCGRILARDHESTPQYAEALRQDHRLRDQRLSLWRIRAGRRP